MAGWNFTKTEFFRQGMSPSLNLVWPRIPVLRCSFIRVSNNGQLFIVNKIEPKRRGVRKYQDIQSPFREDLVILKPAFPVIL